MVVLDFPMRKAMPAHVGERRILIVEDERVVADTLGQILSASGYGVRIAYSAEEALSAISDWAPDIALLDVMLPNMNGIDLAVALQKPIPGCQILLFSGQPSVEGLLQKALHEGHSFEILAKPIHPSVILDKIARLLSANGAEPLTQA
jgi:DNA-binding response OmpR family regulator